MKTWMKLSLLASVPCALISGLALAYQFGGGALRTDPPYEDRLNFGPDRRFNMSRTELQIPAGYGRLVTITASGRGAVLWFESEDGSIRNVNLETSAPLIIQRRGELN